MTNSPGAQDLILQIALPVPLNRLFDYLPPPDCDPALLQPGVRLLVTFGKTRMAGLLLGLSQVSDCEPGKLKPALALLDQSPLLSPDDLDFLHWVSRYCHYPYGQVLLGALPVALRQGKPAAAKRELEYFLTEAGREMQPEQVKRSPAQQALLRLLLEHPSPQPAANLSAYPAAVKSLVKKGWLTSRPQALPRAPGDAPSLPANPEQQQAIDDLIGKLGRFSVNLLHGVTGSGKTEVYMQVIAQALARGQQVLALLPEISLTPQLEHRFRQRFRHVIVCSHSGLNETERLAAWQAMRQGEADIMLGTRSALFTPLQRPGLIILDEEHDVSFKQQDGLRYSARDIAIARAKHLATPVVLGSATPSLESLHNAQRRRYHLLSLPQRAGSAAAPGVHLLDIRNKPLHAGLSEPLLAAVRATLAAGRQTLLFLNRRGYAPVQICHACGWVARCRHCDANLIIHAGERRLRCHHCGAAQALTEICPACKTGALQALGVGTERIEWQLRQMFPDKNIVRLDRDTTQQKGALQDFLQQIASGAADIILGTQMLAKGHHFPGVTLVALLDVDSGLFSIDYRASERLAQLIVQVAGRAGRAEDPGQVLLQTRHPEHPLLQTLLSGGYSAFAEAALRERAAAGLPPFSRQALLRASAPTLEAAEAFLSRLAASLKPLTPPEVNLFGPVPAPMSKRAGRYHSQMLLQSRARRPLHALLDQIETLLDKMKKPKGLRWSLDVDPIDLY